MGELALSYCETICADCPFRRDSTRLTERPGWPDAAAWLTRHGWPGFDAVECNVEGAVCLGWAVYVANLSALPMLPSTHRDWVAEWGKDTDLIFGQNNEFIRYHRGEEFGGADWIEDRKSRNSKPAHSFDEQGQGSLF